ncbi:MAG: hypothetical protein ACI9FJ_000394 [Alteromonadaceae bacterium]|jgi:hypothetical protein
MVIYLLDCTQYPSHLKMRIAWALKTLGYNKRLSATSSTTYLQMPKQAGLNHTNSTVWLNVAIDKLRSQTNIHTSLKSLFFKLYCGAQ